jgi:hypothetical protein
MLKFFRKIRQRLLSENRFTKYLIYAFGEIILVMIGILLALQVNNWNEQRLKQNEIIKVYERLILDLDNDIFELSRSAKFWENKQLVFNSVINDSISTDLLDKGISRILTSTKTSLNKAGINQLKNLNIRSELALEIIQIYDNMENIAITPLENRFSEESRKLILKFRDNYSWYAEWISKTINKDNSSKKLQDYFLYSEEYRNIVFHFNQLIFHNYVPVVKYYIKELESARTDLKLIVDKDTKYVSKTELKKYTGKYEVTENNSQILDFKKGDIFEIIAHDGFIRLSATSGQLNFVDYYMKEDNSFFADMDFGNSSIIFDVSKDLNINGLVERTKTSKLNTLLKAVKVDTSN